MRQLSRRIWHSLKNSAALRGVLTVTLIVALPFALQSYIDNKPVAELFHITPVLLKGIASWAFYMLVAISVALTIFIITVAIIDHAKCEYALWRITKESWLDPLNSLYSSSAPDSYYEKLKDEVLHLMRHQYPDGLDHGRVNLAKNAFHWAQRFGAINGTALLWRIVFDTYQHEEREDSEQGIMATNITMLARVLSTSMRFFVELALDHKQEFDADGYKPHIDIVTPIPPWDWPFDKPTTGSLYDDEVWRYRQDYQSFRLDLANRGILNWFQVNRYVLLDPEDARNTISRFSDKQRENCIQWINQMGDVIFVPRPRDWPSALNEFTLLGVYGRRYKSWLGIFSDMQPGGQTMLLGFVDDNGINCLSNYFRVTEPLHSLEHLKKQLGLLALGKPTLSSLLHELESVTVTM